MGDKSPRKQNKANKLSVKERKAKKKAKKTTAAVGIIPPASGR